MDRDYVFAHGRAVFIFAKLEWSAVNCCARIEPDSAFRECNNRLVALRPRL
jgi:hypothetical protein